MIVSPSKYRFLCTLPLSVILIAFSASACIAAAPSSEASVANSKKQLLLYAKNPATWSIVKKGANGKMVYDEESCGAFTLDASGLYPRSAYALIRYADAPPKVEILARGTSDERGRLHLTGVWRNWTRKFWLVSGEDVAGKTGDAGSLRAWRPGRYLFEEKSIGLDRVYPAPEKRP